eukprot:874834-Prorocentrum_minimum.AAC.2
MDESESDRSKAPLPSRAAKESPASASSRPITDRLGVYSAACKPFRQDIKSKSRRQSCSPTADLADPPFIDQTLSQAVQSRRRYPQANERMRASVQGETCLSALGGGPKGVRRGYGPVICPALIDG